jgi:hypothetical protein
MTHEQRIKPTADECITAEVRNGTFHVTVKPVPSWLSDDEKNVLSKQIKKREKEMFEEYARQRSQEQSLLSPVS